MRSVSTLSGVEGHLPGGPRCFPRLRVLRRPLPAIAVAAVTLAGSACGGARGGGPEGARPTAGEAFSRPLEIYRDLGFMTGSGQFPVVASLATVAGPRDSTYVLLGMSLPNSALRYQRDPDGSGFFAEYRIEVTFMDPDSIAVKRFEARELVRISTFAETGRTDESVVYQQGFTLPPGSYIVRLQAADVNSSRGFRMTDTLTAPDYSLSASVSSPVLVYEAAGRTHRDVMPDLISNPRHTVPYGGAAPLLYVESYGASTRPVDVRVLNEAGGMVWSATAALRGGGDDLRYGVVEIPAEALPLGKFWVEVSDGARPSRTPIVMTISDQWMVANLEDVLDFLRFIAHPEELDSLQMGGPADQRAAWDRFWERRDPLLVTDVNEYRDAFFQRVRYATEAFREAGGRAGWNTDRGEVYIVLGPPDNSVERYIGERDITRQPNAEEWVYTAVPGGRLNLLFYDRSGFGRYELVPSSSAAFRSVADRLKPRPERN
jgi:GWxTD domain-containing protein